jgi:hypothetical protein
MMIKSVIAFLFVFVCMQTAYSQKRKKSEQTIEFTLSPSLGFRILGNFTLPNKYYGTRSTFQDSLRAADRPGQMLNFGLQWTKHKNAFEAISFGLSYTSLGFRRLRENIKIGSEIHPDLPIVSHFIQAGPLTATYEFRYRYVEASILWHFAAESFGDIKDFNMSYIVGFSPAVMIGNPVKIHTSGFSLDGKNDFVVKDKVNTALFPNAFAQVGFRSDYIMFKKVHALFQPRLRIPVLPSTQGAQTIWSPQFSIDLGLIYTLNTGSR